MNEATSPVSIPIIAITNQRAISLFNIHCNQKQQETIKDSIAGLLGSQG